LLIISAFPSQGSDQEEEDSDDDGAKALERDLEEAYQTYLANKSDDGLKGTRLAKRKKMAKAALASAQAAEDAVMYDGDIMGYVDLLTKGQKRDKKRKDGEDEDDDDGGDTSSEEEEEEEVGAEEDEEEEEHPLLRKVPVKRSAQVERWFSNPVFQGLDIDKLGEKGE